MQKKRENPLQNPDHTEFDSWGEGNRSSDLVKKSSDFAVIPMPIEAKNSSDKTNRENFKRESRQKEDDGAEEGQSRLKLGDPVLVTQCL